MVNAKPIKITWFKDEFNLTLDLQSDKIAKLTNQSGFYFEIKLNVIHIFYPFGMIDFLG